MACYRIAKNPVTRTLLAVVEGTNLVTCSINNGATVDAINPVLGVNSRQLYAYL